MLTSASERCEPKALATMATHAKPQSQLLSCVMWGIGVVTCMGMLEMRMNVWAVEGY